MRRINGVDVPTESSEDIRLDPRFGHLLVLRHTLTINRIDYYFGRVILDLKRQAEARLAKAHEVVAEAEAFVDRMFPREVE